jgi:23S rRNA maturation mini-RNase III
MVNKGNYKSLAISAAKHANDIRQASRNVENSLHNRARLNSIVAFWKTKLSRNSTNIVRRARNLGVHSNKYQVDTPEYYSLLVNLAMNKAR